MIRIILISFGLIWVLTGVTIFVDPMRFYEMVPGLKLMGPFNVHFIRDVGLAFVASGGTLGWGSYRSARGLVDAGIAWPSLHALFHIQIWEHRGYPFDVIFAFDLALVISPPLLALLLARKMAMSNG